MILIHFPTEILIMFTLPMLVAIGLEALQTAQQMIADGRQHTNEEETARIQAQFAEEKPIEDDLDKPAPTGN